MLCSGNNSLLPISKYPSTVLLEKVVVPTSDLISPSYFSQNGAFIINLMDSKAVYQPYSVVLVCHTQYLEVFHGDKPTGFFLWKD